MDTQEYWENIKKCNESIAISKINQAISLMEHARDLLKDPEVNSSIGISNPEYPVGSE